MKGLAELFFYFGLGILLMTIIPTVLITLRCVDYITWSWFWVLTPFWVIVPIIGAVVIFKMIYGVIR